MKYKTKDPAEKAAVAAAQKARYASTNIDAKLLNECFEYDAEAGVLAWRARPLHHFKTVRDMQAWNTRYAGKAAGRLRRCREYDNVITGVGVSIYKKLIPVAQIAWRMCVGDIPKGMTVDHRDCDPTNNRLSNLRLATPSQQQWNKRKPRYNTLGYKGVTYHKRDGLYVAKVFVGGKRAFCKYFKTPEQAHAAYCKAAAEIHGEFARTA